MVTLTRLLLLYNYRKSLAIKRSALGRIFSCFTFNCVEFRAVSTCVEVNFNVECGQMDISSSDAVRSYKWYPNSVINEGVGSRFGGYACLVLNRKIRIRVEVAQQIWQNAFLRCAVDGGANRWRNFLDVNCQEKCMKPPDLITGDFDSITESTLHYFNDIGTRRVHTPDQNETDFTKAIRVVRPLLDKEQLNDIIAFHDEAGRFDHIMANINTLYKLQSARLNVYLLSGTSMTWLLRPGKHSIRIPHELVEKQCWCALMPIGEPATCVTTIGLKWDLTNDTMQFGTLISTSNTYASEHVQIETSTCLVWSMGLFGCED